MRIDLVADKMVLNSHARRGSFPYLTASFASDLGDLGLGNLSLAATIPGGVTRRSFGVASAKVQTRTAEQKEERGYNKIEYCIGSAPYSSYSWRCRSLLFIQSFHPFVLVLRAATTLS